MRFLYVLRATRLAMLTEGSTPEEEAVVDRHFQHLQRLARDGTVLHVGRTATNDEDTMGLVVFEAPDEPAARAIAEADPAVVAGVMTATVFPYRQVFPD